MNALPRLSALLRDLHRGAEQVDAAAFQGWAFERLRQDIPFDSAMWASGAGTEQGPLFHAIHLHDQPMQMLHDYEGLKQHDQLFARALAAHGRSLRAAAATDMVPALQAYAAQYQLAQALCTMVLDDETALITCVSLYRSDAAQAFGDNEATFMEAVFPHLADCDARSKLARLGRADAAATRLRWAGAACDAMGLLRCVDASFAGALRAEWPSWRGPWLPEVLRPLVLHTTPGAPVGRAGWLRVQPMGELRLVQLRARQPVDDLPPRLREVALLAAQGLSHKAIAAALKISPATARNQLAALYRRLGVSSKTALAARIFDGEAEAP